MPRGVLFIGGQGPPPEKSRCILDSQDMVCAADSGLDAALAAGIQPDGVVGDMDSLSDPVVLRRFSADVVEVYPEDKDDSDTIIGLKWLRKRHCQPIVIIGGGEGRLDHTVALLQCFEGAHAPNFWYTAWEWSQRVWHSTVLAARVGTLVSFYAIGTGPWKVHSQGLQWELDDVVWEDGKMSLSNRFKTDQVRLEIFSGTFLVMQAY